MNLLEFASAGGTLLILFFTGLTFWHQFIRTPRSDVRISSKERTKPYSTGKQNLTFSAPSAQLSNTGEMAAIIEDADASADFLDCESGEMLDEDALQDEIEVGINRRSKNSKLGSGTTRRDKARIRINDISKLPAEFRIRVKYKFRIRDNLDEYEKSISTEFKFENKAVSG